MSIKDKNWQRGCVQVYTGSGKGKSTAAFGLALRAYGAGASIYIAQFIKGQDCSELKTFSKLSDSITIERFGSGKWLGKDGINVTHEDHDLASVGIAAAKEALSSGKYDIVILDEIFGALTAGVISLEQILALLDKRLDMTELVLTGRNAPEEILSKADLVTQMQEVKHYYKSGLKARIGIEN